MPEPNWQERISQLNRQGRISELHCKSGDVIGFSAGDPLGAAINVSTLGWPCWPPCWRGLTHVGIIANGNNGDLVLWEATTLCDLPCVHCGESHGGLQAHLLATRIKQYCGPVWHYPLKQGLDTTQRLQLVRHSKKYHNRSYDFEGAMQSRVLCLGWFWQRYGREELSSLFCSEFVASALNATEVWDTPNASIWNPNRLARTLVATGITGKPRRLK